MPLDAKNFYLIRTTTGGSILCRRGTDAPKLVSGGARFTVIERPRRKSTVQWEGDDPYRMDVSFLLDGWADGTSIEPACSKLNLLRQSPGDLTPPPEIYVDGSVPVKGATWVVEDLTWGDMVLWSAKTGAQQGYRLRQDGVLHLLQSVPLAVLKLNRAPSATTPYIVRVGDTLNSIATKYNVSVADIKKVNNMRDPKTITRMVGGTLLIPPGVTGLK